MEKEHVGTAQVENDKKNYEKKAQQALDVVKKNLQEKIKQQVPEMMRQIKNELMGFFQVVAYWEFQLVFHKHYGKNYDVNSLNKSLRFYMDDNLCPHVKYDAKSFYIKTDFDVDRRSFNQNANIEGSFDRLMDFESLDAVEEMNFFGLSIGEDSPYDWATSDASVVSNRKVFSRTHKSKLRNPKEVYEEAEANTMQAFWSNYERILKPRIISKYKLKL